MSLKGEPMEYRTYVHLLRYLLYNEIPTEKLLREIFSNDDGHDVVVDDDDKYGGNNITIATSTTTMGGRNGEADDFEALEPVWRASVIKASVIAQQENNQTKANTRLIAVGENYSNITGGQKLLAKHLDSRTSSSNQAKHSSNIQHLLTSNLAGRENNDENLIKFLSWANKMFFKRNPSSDENGLQVVSLMSSESEKEVAPRESFKQIIMEMHCKEGTQGENHLSLADTIAEIRKTYTFGHHDFGMSTSLVNNVLAECPAPGCAIRTLHGMTSGQSDPANLPTCSSTASTPTPLIVDQFYQEVASVIIEDELQLFCPKAISKEKETRDKIVNIKKAGGFPNARASKRKMEDKEPQADKVKTTPSTAESMIESMSMQESYDCLVHLACQMRRELLVAYAGERRHYERLSKSVVAALAMVRRCQALNNSITYN